MPEKLFETDEVTVTLEVPPDRFAKSRETCVISHMMGNHIEQSLIEAPRKRCLKVIRDLLIKE